MVHIYLVLANSTRNVEAKEMIRKCLNFDNRIEKYILLQKMNISAKHAFHRKQIVVAVEMNCNNIFLIHMSLYFPEAFVHWMW